MPTGLVRALNDKACRLLKWNPFFHEMKWKITATNNECHNEDEKARNAYNERLFQNALEVIQVCVEDRSFDGIKTFFYFIEFLIDCILYWLRIKLIKVKIDYHSEQLKFRLIITSVHWNCYWLKFQIDYLLKFGYWTSISIK